MSHLFRKSFSQDSFIIRQRDGGGGADLRMSFLDGEDFLERGDFLGIPDNKGDKDAVGSSDWGKDGEVQFAESNGRRKSQEDSTVCVETPLKTAKQAVNFLSETYVELSSSLKGETQGSAAVTAVITPDGKLSVANTGDSQVVVYVKDNSKAPPEVTPIELNSLHTVESETDAIRKAGGFILFGRVGGQFKIGRAFGDGGIVSSEPDITTFDLNPLLNNPNLQILVEVSCDGLREKTSKADLSAQMQNSDLENFASGFITDAFKKGSEDNLSCFVVLVPSNLRELDSGLVVGVYDGHGGREVSDKVSTGVAEKNRQLDQSKLQQLENKTELPKEFKREISLPVELQAASVPNRPLSKTPPKKVEATVGFIEEYKSVAIEVKTVQKPKAKTARIIPAPTSSEKTTAEKRAEIEAKKPELLARREGELARRAAEDKIKEAQKENKPLIYGKLPPESTVESSNTRETTLASAAMKTAQTSIEIFNEQLKKVTDPIARKDIQAKIKAEEKKRDAKTGVVVDDLLSSLLYSSQGQPTAQIAPTVAKKPALVVPPSPAQVLEPMPSFAPVLVAKDLKDKDYLGNCRAGIEKMKQITAKYDNEKGNYPQKSFEISKLQRQFAIEMRQALGEFDANMRVLEDRNAAKILFKNTKQLDGLRDEVLEMRLRNQFMVAQVEYVRLRAGEVDAKTSVKTAASGVETEEAFIKYKKHQLSKHEPNSEAAATIQEQIVDAREAMLSHIKQLNGQMTELTEKLDDLKEERTSKAVVNGSKEDKQYKLQKAELEFDISILNNGVTRLAFIAGDTEARESSDTKVRQVEVASQALSAARREFEMTRTPAAPTPLSEIFSPPPGLPIPEARPLSDLRRAQVTQPALTPPPTLVPPPVVTPSADNSAQKRVTDAEKKLLEAREEKDRLGKEKENAKKVFDQSNSVDNLKKANAAIFKFNECEIKLEKAKAAYYNACVDFKKAVHAPIKSILEDRVNAKRAEEKVNVMEMKLIEIRAKYEGYDYSKFEASKTTVTRQNTPKNSTLPKKSLKELKQDIKIAKKAHKNSRSRDDFQKVNEAILKFNQAKKEDYSAKLEKQRQMSAPYDKKSKVERKLEKKIQEIENIAKTHEVKAKEYNKDEYKDVNFVVKPKTFVEKLKAQLANIVKGKGQSR